MAPRSAWKRSVRLIGLTATGFIGYQSTLLFLEYRRGRISQSVPSLLAFQDAEDVPVRSPVAVLDQAAANAKLRKEAQTLLFDGSGGGKGRVDLVRLASNNPVEDEWSLAVGTGPGGAKGLLYAGVYDGHA